MLGEVLEILDVKGDQSELVREAMAAARSARRSRPITTAVIDSSEDLRDSCFPGSFEPAGGNAT